MKSNLRAISTASVLVLCTTAFVLATQDTNVQTLPDATCLTDFLPNETIVDLKSSGDKYILYIVSKKQAIDHNRNVTEMLRDIRNAEEKESPDMDKINRIKSNLSNWSALWKVTGRGTSFVRLEPFVRIPGWENVAWIVLPESTISMIKQRG